MSCSTKNELKLAYEKYVRYWKIMFFILNLFQLAIFIQAARMSKFEPQKYTTTII